MQKETVVELVLEPGYLPALGSQLTLITPDGEKTGTITGMSDKHPPGSNVWLLQVRYNV